MAEHYEAESNSKHVPRRKVKLSVLTDSIIVGYILWKQIQLDVKKNLSDPRRKRTGFQKGFPFLLSAVQFIFSLSKFPFL